MIHEIVYHGITAAKLQKRYTLSAPAMNAQRYEKAGKMHEAAGTPHLFSSPELRTSEGSLEHKVYDVTKVEFENEMQIQITAKL